MTVWRDVIGQDSAVSTLHRAATDADLAGLYRHARFTVALQATPERIDVVDRAGNRRQVFPDDSVIYEANQTQIRDPDLIYPGQLFVVPRTN